MPTIAGISPQIGDVVEYRDGSKTVIYVMDRHGLKSSKGIYLSQEYFNGSEKYCPHFHILERASNVEPAKEKIEPAKEKIEPAKEKFEVGEKYVLDNGRIFTCISVEGGYAWMKSAVHSIAYVWYPDGNPYSSLHESFKVNWQRSNLARATAEKLLQLLDEVPEDALVKGKTELHQELVSVLEKHLREPKN